MKFLVIALLTLSIAWSNATVEESGSDTTLSRDLSLHQLSEPQSEPDSTQQASASAKIAFLFMSRGHMPLEDVWKQFFHWRADPKQFSIYTHPHPGYKFPPTSFFHGKEVKENANVKWGGMSQVRGIKALVREALEDPSNQWFCLMSESCIPLVSFERWRDTLLANNKSVVNACWLHPAESERETR